MDEWRPKTADNPIKADNDLVKIKEKMKQKQEAEMAKKREEDEAKRKKDQQWNTMTPVSSTNQELLKEKPKENIFNENLFRPQVAIQWGQKGFKGKTPDPQTNVKKAVPFVGKMPSKKKETPDR